jgi:hypothetical protein
MLSELYPFDPSEGGTFTLHAFVIVVLGGLGTPWGAVAGGLVFGLAEAVVPLIPGIGPGYDEAIAFAVFNVAAVTPDAVMLNDNGEMIDDPSFAPVPMTPAEQERNDAVLAELTFDPEPE